MRDVLPELMQWWRDGKAVGVGTVVATFRSAPRPAGAAMLVGPGGEAVGSVSGGCVEGAVYELGQEVVASGAPVLQRYGVSDDDAFAVGLTCGGILDVFVETVSQETFPELGAVSDDIDAGRPVAVATVIDHPDPAWVGRRLVVRPQGADGMPTGSLGSPRADSAVTACWPPGAPRPSPTGPTGSAAVRACGCSSPPTPRARGCSSSAPSTSPRRWRTWVRSWATG